MHWQAPITDEQARHGVFSAPAHYTAGAAIGVIAVDLDYPKIPGNVANASTFGFPVMYKKVEFEIERLFAGDPSLVDVVITAAKELEAEGVRAIVGACGFFAHFQKDVANAVKVPVFLSSLTQLPLIKISLGTDQKVLVLAADGPSVNNSMLAKVGTDDERVIVQNVGDRKAFSPIRWGKTTLDNGALIEDLVELAEKQLAKHPEIGAILLECSDLPPYAFDLQVATGLPVYDFITLINWIHSSVVQHPYYGWL